MTEKKSLGHACCLALSALIGDKKVAIPGSTEYDESLASYFSAQQASIHPACIVSPETSSEVSVVLTTLTNTKGGRCTFAIRAGGHTPWAGASNIADGVVIDLRALNTVEISVDHASVSVGAGATWDAVYEKLDPLNLSVNGGRTAGVGVGGLTLGGGISFFSPRYGWTCDAVSNFQTVLADGSIVDANATQNPDLYFALRGGGNNFGIVTRIDFNTFQQGSIWTGTINTALSTVDANLEAFVKINSASEYDEYASFITAFGYSQARGLSAISNQLEYTKAVENPEVYREILKLPTLSSVARITNMSSHSRYVETLQPKGKRFVTSSKNGSDPD